MKITPCPICGRVPTIRDAVPVKRYKNGIRRRLCGCNNYCSVIPYADHLYRSWFEFDGEGDDNTVFREWNKAIELYQYDENLDPSKKWKSWRFYAIY